MEQPLDAELKSAYSLTVTALDHANTGMRKQSSAKVRIYIVDVNDNDPQFKVGIRDLVDRRYTNMQMYYTPVKRQYINAFFEIAFHYGKRAATIINFLSFISIDIKGFPFNFGGKIFTGFEMTELES